MSHPMMPIEALRGVSVAVKDGFVHTCFVMTLIGKRKRGDMRTWLRRRGPEGYYQGKVEFDHLKETSWCEIDITRTGWGDFEPGCVIYAFRSEPFRDQFLARWHAFRYYIPLAPRQHPVFETDEISEVEGWCGDQFDELAQTAIDPDRPYVVVRAGGYSQWNQNFANSLWFATNDQAVASKFRAAARRCRFYRITEDALPKQGLSHFVPVASEAEAFRWCLDNFEDFTFGNVASHQGKSVFGFKNEDDAFHFKMRWR